MLAHDYAKAFASIIQKNETDTLLGELDRVLTKRGHQKLRKQILSALLVEFAAKKRRHESVVSVAKTEHATEYADNINAVCKELNISEKPEVVVDESLIGGFVVHTNNYLLDKSYKRTLIELYRNIIHSV